MRELWKLEILEREANKIEISFAELSNLLFCGGGVVSLLCVCLRSCGIMKYILGSEMMVHLAYNS
jgi:hypothetical protein